MSDIKKVRVVVGIGSNIDRKKNISKAMELLGAEFGAISNSPVYESVAEGFEGPDFYNLVCFFSCTLTIDVLSKRLKHIEDLAGRDRSGADIGSRTLDIDVLLYGDADLTSQGYDIPRAEILHYAFVLKPLADVLPNDKHPVLGQSYIELWQKRGTTTGALTQLGWDPISA